MYSFRPLWGICFLSFAAASYCQRVNPNDPSWRNDQVRHKISVLNTTSLQKLCQLSDTQRINTYLDNILVPRPVGSESHKRVAMYIKRTLEDLGYHVEFDRFTEQTIVGWRTFRNVVATLDPLAPRRLTLACHYDSKDFRPTFEFLGATDSAFPCAAILDVAQTLSPYISNRGATDVTLQLIFFDGEEAFLDWTETDSLYGSRHLAKQLEYQLYPPYNLYNTREVNRIDYLILLDLLGAEGSIPNFVTTNDHQIYPVFWNTEFRLRDVYNCMDTTRPALFSGFRQVYPVEDDHVPFRKAGVRIMHMIPTPFPRVWHTRDDNRSALIDGVMKNVATIMRAFTAQYLDVRI